MHRYLPLNKKIISSPRLFLVSGFWFLVFSRNYFTHCLEDISVVYHDGAVRRFFHEAIRRFSGDI